MRLQFGDFVFDSRLHSLSRGSERLEISPKAFLLLEILIEARPAPVPKEALYDRLWPATFVEPGNLHNLISEIRAALEDDEHKTIKTVRGAGYAFDASGKTLEATRFAVVVAHRLIQLQTGENIIGRDPAAAVSIDSPDVSRNHACITVSGTTLTIEDLGSKNGTFIGADRITKPRVIQPGDDIVIGRTLIVLRAINPGTTVTV